MVSQLAKWTDFQPTQHYLNLTYIAVHSCIVSTHYFAGLKATIYMYYCMDWYITEKEMEAERESLYKAIGYAKGEALEPFTKEVFTICGVVGTHRSS